MPTRAWAGNTTPSAVLAFNALGVLVVYALQRLQGVLPSNPPGWPRQPRLVVQHSLQLCDHTNWQGYGGEATMSYLTQMLALTGAELLLRRHRHRGVIALIRGSFGALVERDRQRLGRLDAL